MILVFGQFLMGIECHYVSALKTDQETNAGKTNIEINGTAALLSITGARAGAHIGVIGTIGRDTFGNQIMSVFKREGIQVTGLLQSDKKTGTIILLNDEDKKTRIRDPGANFHTSNTQAPDTVLNVRTLLVLHDSFNLGENLSLAKRAKSQGARIMLVCEGRQPDTFKKEYSRFCDIVISRYDIEPDAGTTLYINAHKEGTAGASFYNGGQAQASRINAEQKTLDCSGAYEAFCGTFAACIQAQTRLKNALNYAITAAQITAQNQGTYSAFPYLAEIEEQLKNQAQQTE